ncbi:hypothetical protein TorRG33x02_172150 [Trema orientale]|uniref:Uncharacterized protein n=1 Tax=Trema orientale TaxID=63057 RepID=A0A2P5EN24_TREOI|nr:hypothetical protein TorRG33x02_172150 [Trema orientale]
MIEIFRENSVKTLAAIELDRQIRRGNVRYHGRTRKSKTFHRFTEIRVSREPSVIDENRIRRSNVVNFIPVSSSFQLDLLNLPAINWVQTTLRVCPIVEGEMKPAKFSTVEWWTTSAESLFFSRAKEHQLRQKKENEQTNRRHFELPNRATNIRHPNRNLVI